MSLPSVSASTYDNQSRTSTPSPSSPSIPVLAMNVTLNLNSPNFDAEYYVQNLLRKKGLEELVAVEQDMVNSVRRLDSEMQSLVYENYSKFLNATSTVREMQNRLANTQNEMRDLSIRTKRITKVSNLLTEKFATNCEKVKKLNEARDSVKKLELLIKAPQILQNFVEQGQLVKAVNIYVTLKPKLKKFQYIQSMAGITEDVEKIIAGIKTKFEEILDSRLISSEEVIEAVLTLKLFEIPEQQLEERLLTCWEREMQKELDLLESNPEKSHYPDIFDFVDTGCCHFLTNLSLMASTFLQLFPKQSSKTEFVQLLVKIMQRFEQIVDERFQKEQNVDECALYVRALDRIYRKISVLTRLSSGFNFSRVNANIVQRCAKYKIMHCRRSLIDSFQKAMIEVFSELNNSLPPSSSSRSDNGRSSFSHPTRGIYYDRKELLKRTVDKLEQTFLHSLKTSLASLLMFTASDIIFSTISHFIPLFGFDVHEQIVIGAIQDVIDELRTRTEAMINAKVQDKDGQATEVLILCTFSRNLHLKHLDYLVELCKEQYRLADFHLAEKHKLTSTSEVAEKLTCTVEYLLRKFVEIQSNTCIQMMQRSIDIFDWAECVELPSRVRTLVKHFIHLMEETNKDLAAFMDDGGIAKYKERIPDSLRGYSTMKRATSTASSFYNDASSMGSGGVVERLWGETDTPDESGISSMETVATIHVEFRWDVLTNAIIRLVLQAMCEFVRLKKFSQYGLQQLQVDCAYMRLKLWACVSDEHMLNMGIEDVVTAAVNQCSQPKLLEPSIVRNICEEN